MKNKMFKKQSRTIIFFLLVYICTFNSANAQPGNLIMEKLESRLSAYKEAFRSGDYVSAASLVSPNMIKKVGGKENFARLVQKFTDSTIITLKPSLVEFSKPGIIVSDDDMYISVIRQTIPITTKGIEEELKDAYLLFHPNFPATVFEGMDGVFKMSIIAYSEDEGNTWFFAGGNKMSLSVENIKPEIIEKITIPVHTLIFGEGSDKIILYRQNKQWIRSASGISEGLAEESIIFTIDEQMDDSPSNMTKQDIPDDSLDAYIYIEEHSVVPIGTPGETNTQARDDSIKKRSENKQETSKNISQSVFATNNSNTYHQPDCPELGTGDLLEFDSTEEALESGGVPCKQCYPQ
ncbi:MAG: hypothetical protein HON76_17630 [Candidatus Scalindua sp.]|jgi:hypothetical protein|nr:hypothetical protein [Candidatus Scalindua sp.]MBT5305504.1 hypothetical protein [Candidatus Scalindua sp.]MBT6045344.1 hypothetical protein [Candidatus Scalindua sp.]MBT6226716.1 hypothetical protein [Candidatus Scalindua sp.]MBT6564341.1 hypothetical protein [Candidatus Scalindua sp.]